MSIRIALSLAAAAGLVAAPVRAEETHSPHLHHALHELKEAKTELKDAKHDFGGHREKALEATEAAIKQIHEALEAVGAGKFDGKYADKDTYKTYKHHPHIHHAIHELKLAEKDLKESKHDYKGHREKAQKDIEYAIKELTLALEHHEKK